MVSYDPKAWLRVTFSYSGTVIPRVINRVLILAGVTLAWWLFCLFMAWLSDPVSK
jgi:predicted membrane chloride channel (bestrophin family)